MQFFRYLSTLYSHPKWPNVHPSQIRDDLRENVKDNWMWLLLTPSWMYKHLKIILEKKTRGQPVSFTDFFGYLVGETILKDVSFFHYVFPTFDEAVKPLYNGHPEAKLTLRCREVSMRVMCKDRPTRRSRSATCYKCHLPCRNSAPVIEKVYKWKCETKECTWKVNMRCSHTDSNGQLIWAM